MSHRALNPAQFKYEYREPYPGVMDYHTLEATVPGQKKGETPAGYLRWSSKGGEIRSIQVEPEYQRKGVATAMYQHAQEMAAGSRKIAAPKHSPQRTKQGQAWAKSVGGRLPRLQQGWDRP